MQQITDLVMRAAMGGGALVLAGRLIWSQVFVAKRLTAVRTLPRCVEPPKELCRELSEKFATIPCWPVGPCISHPLFIKEDDRVKLVVLLGGSCTSVARRDKLWSVLDDDGWIFEGLKGGVYQFRLGRWRLSFTPGSIVEVRLWKEPGRRSAAMRERSAARRREDAS